MEWVVGGGQLWLLSLHP